MLQGSSRVRPRWRVTLRTIATWSSLSCLCFVAFLGVGLGIPLARAGTDPFELFQLLARVTVLIENEYVEPADRGRLLDGAIRGMVGALDPHSSYMSPKEFATFQSDTEGQFGGIGVEVDFRGGEVTVIAPIEGSPAARAGIRPGDKIVSIEGRSVVGQNMDELVQRMRGPVGSRVRLSLRREGNDGLMQFSLQRELIDVASVTGRNLVDGIAYIRIKQFQRGTHDELLDAIAQLRDGNRGVIRGVILDLRNNPGGLVSEAVAVADEFLSEGGIYTTRHRGKIVDRIDASRGGALAGEPLVALVNEYSASASELVAGALQDNHRATLVGAPTFGKGSVQSIIALPGGGGMRLTTMRYYTPKGHAIQADGVNPDVQVRAAYVVDKSFGVVRERDLENHLPGEGSPATSASVPPDPDAKEEIPGVSATHLGVAREVPADPTGGPDFALSIGFQIVRGVLAGK